MSRWKSAAWCLITNIRIKFTFINFLPRLLHFTYYWRQLPGISLHSHGPYEFMASRSAVPQQIPSREPIENIKSISQWHLKYSERRGTHSLRDWLARRTCMELLLEQQNLRLKWQYCIRNKLPFFLQRYVICWK